MQLNRSVNTVENVIVYNQLNYKQYKLNVNNEKHLFVTEKLNSF